MTLGALIVTLAAVVTVGTGALKVGPIVTTSLVLEEVLEHGPLFDELEDEAWWSGVDVVDTALPSALQRFWSPPTSADAIDVFAVESAAESGWTDDASFEFCRFWNENDGCPSASASFGLPRLPPPPPAPPALSDLIRQLQQRQKSPDHAPVSEDDDCLLCQWAALNGTIDLVPNSELSSDNSWVPMLVVVALGSAMLGAVLMITALKCRRLKVLPRGGSCPTLPVGYMVGEGKDGVVVQTNVAEIDTISKSYTLRNSHDALGRPRLDTPTLMSPQDVVQGQGSSKRQQQQQQQPSKRWNFWKNNKRADDPYADQSDAMSAVYAELNSVAGSSVVPPSVALYHLNTYSEIREPGQHLIPPQATQTAATLHLRRLLSDGTYENAAYALERGVILVEHENSSTPSSAYYSDLSHSDRSGSLHNHLWQQQRHHQQHQQRARTESLSAHSLPYHHCCHHHDADAVVRPARDLMPVALSVVPDNQQVPVYDQFARCSAASSSLRGADDGKRPLPPLPSRQQQRPQRRFAYAVDPQHQHEPSGGSASSGSDSTLSCVPSEYV